MDIYPANNPVWKKDKSTFVNVNNSQVLKFRKKYGLSSIDDVGTTLALNC